MKGYVWYSYGSDATGPKLAEGLGFEQGKKTPKFQNFDVIVGWGCKPGEKYNSAALGSLIGKREVRVLNHPDMVKGNRDKLASIQQLKKAGVSVPGFAYCGENDKTLFATVLKALDKGELDFPLLGLNRFHKGYPVYCYTVEDVGVATNPSKNKLHYFRSFCPGQELRIHVFRDEALSAEVKVLQDNPVKCFSEHLMKKLSRRATKEEVELRATEKEIEWIAEGLAHELMNGPNHLQRSVTHGWALQSLPLKDVPDQALAQAINAIEAAELDMGAVSIVVDGDVTRVTGVTSAPGLSEEQMSLYVSSIQEFAKAKKPKAKKAAATASVEGEDAPKELIARLKRKLTGLSRKKAQKVLETLEE